MYNLKIIQLAPVDSSPPICSSQSLRKLRRSSSSLLATNLSDKLFNKYLQGENADDFELVIRSGMLRSESKIGIYAPNYHAYSTFNELFDPIIVTGQK